MAQPLTRSQRLSLCSLDVKRGRAPPAHTKMRTAYDLKAQLENAVSKAPRPSLQDPILLALDVGMFGHSGSINEIGVAYLDSRFFRNACRGGNDPAIQTHHYFVRDPDPGRFSNEPLTKERLKSMEIREQKTILRARLDFDKSNSAFVYKNQLIHLLQHIFHHQSNSRNLQAFELVRADTVKKFSTSPSTQCRPIILVGHGIDSDLKALSLAGFVPQIPMSSVDTWKVADCLFPNIKNERLRSPLTLRGLCLRLGIKPQRLHVSGRDAQYSMVAALKMAAIIYQEEQSDEGLRIATKLLKASKSTTPSIQWRQNPKS